MKERLERCDREINEIYDRAMREPMPAWLVALGVNDWEAERALIAQESEVSG